MTQAYAWVQDEPQRLCATLTEQERDVLVFTAKGLTMDEIASLLGFASRGTVNERRKSIYRKLDVSSSEEAAVIAAKAGLV